MRLLNIVPFVGLHSPCPPLRWWEGELTSEAEYLVCACTGVEQDDTMLIRAVLPLALLLRLAAWPLRLYNGLRSWIRRGKPPIWSLLP